MVTANADFDAKTVERIHRPEGRGDERGGGYIQETVRASTGEDAVRKRPGKYIGPTDERDLNNTRVREVADDAVNEAFSRPRDPRYPFRSYLECKVHEADDVDAVAIETSLTDFRIQGGDNEVYTFTEAHLIHVAKGNFVLLDNGLYLLMAATLWRTTSTRSSGVKPRIGMNYIM